MDQFRNKDVSTICGLEVTQVEDYQLGTIKNLREGSTEALSLPETNLIRFIFDEGFIALRPSGTEPKIKLYFSLNIEDIDALTNQFKEEYINHIK